MTSVGTLVHLAFTVVWIAACDAPRASQRDTAAERASDSVRAWLARDTSILFTASRDPQYQAIDSALDRILPRRNPALERVDTGCVIASPEGGRPAVPNVRLTCRMRDDALPIDIALVGDDADQESLRLLAPRSDSVRQSLALDDLDARRHAGLIELMAVDLDGDGVRELLRLTAAGVHNNFYTVWHFDTAAARLYVDTADKEVVNPRRVPGRPCVDEWSSSGFADRAETVRCHAGGRWTTVLETRVRSEKTLVIRTLSLLLDGALRVIRTDTIPRASWE